MVKKKSSVRKIRSIKRRSRKTRLKRNVRVEIRSLTLKAIKDRRLNFNELSGLADEVLHQAIRPFKNLKPTSRRSAIGKIVHGIADAWAVTAKSTAAGLRHAKKNGVRLAKRDLTQLGSHLHSLEKDFISTLNRYSRKVGGDVGDELKSLSTRLNRTGTAIRPAVKTASNAVANHGTEALRDVVSAGANVGANALRSVLLTASGMLEGLGKSIEGSRTSRSSSKKG